MANFGVILAAALVTYAARLAGFSLVDRELPPALGRFLAYVPIAVFAALVAPDLGLGDAQWAARTRRRRGGGRRMADTSVVGGGRGGHGRLLARRVAHVGPLPLLARGTRLRRTHSVPFPTTRTTLRCQLWGLCGGNVPVDIVPGGAYWYPENEPSGRHTG